jgi:hypothetical protein
VYGLYTQGTNSGFSNFQIERNGTAGIHIANANNRFTSGEVIWNGATVNTEAAVYVSGARNVLTAIEAEDNYTSGFFDNGSDDEFIGCVSDSNGYVQRNPHKSSLIASGFIIDGTGGIYIGNKVTSYSGRLPDGNFATEWPYKIENTNQSRIDISYDSTNQPPPVVAGDLQSVTNISMLPSTGIATSAATDASSAPLYFRGSFWNGSSAVFSDWQIQHVLQHSFDVLAFTPPAPGTSPGSPAVTFPPLATATSTSGNFNSVLFQIQSSVWTGSASTFPGWEFQSTVGTGTTPAPVLKLLPYNPTGTPLLQIQSDTDIFNAL